MLHNYFLQGMVYLHSRLGRRHGCLTSRNVVVDSNWSCKVTDISMPLFRMNDQLRQENHCTHVYSEIFMVSSFEAVVSCIIFLRQQSMHLIIVWLC